MTDWNDADLQKKAKDHLWMHFTRQSGVEEGHGVPIIVKGDGHHIWDSTGKKYFDGLSGLFVPVEALPPALQILARMLPLTYAVSLLRGVWHGEGWLAHWLDFAADSLYRIV